MFKDFNKKIVFKTTIKWEIINTIISSIIGSIILYMILIYYSDVLIELLKATKGKELEFTYIMFPIILIINFTLIFTKIAFNDSLKKGRRKK